MNSILQNRLKQINELYLKEFKAIEKQYHQFKLAFQNTNLQTRNLQNYVQKAQSLNMLYLAFTKNFINIIPKNDMIDVLNNMSGILSDQTKKLKQIIIKDQEKKEKAFDSSNIIKTSNNCQRCAQNIRKINIQQIKISVENQYLGIIERMMKQIKLQINQSLFSQEEDNFFYKKLNEALKRKQESIQQKSSSIQSLISLMQSQILKVVKFKKEYNDQNNEVCKINEHLIKNIQQTLSNLLNEGFKSKIPIFMQKMFKMYEKIYKNLNYKPKQQVQVQTEKWQSQEIQLLNQKLIKIGSLCFKQENDINWLQKQLSEQKKHLVKKQKQWIESYQKLNQQNLSNQALLKSFKKKVEQFSQQIVSKQNKINQLKNKSKLKLKVQENVREKQSEKNFKIQQSKNSNKLIQVNGYQQQNKNQEFNRQGKRKKTLKSKKMIQSKSSKKVHQNLSSISNLFQEEFLINNENQGIMNQNVDKQQQNYNQNQSKVLFNECIEQNQQQIEQITKDNNNYQLYMNNDEKEDQVNQVVSQSSKNSNQLNSKRNSNLSFRENLKSGKSLNYLQVTKVSHLLQQKVNRQKKNINIWKDLNEKRITKNQNNLFSQQTIQSKTDFKDNKNKYQTPRISVLNQNPYQNLQQLKKDNKTQHSSKQMKFDPQFKKIIIAKQKINNKPSNKKIISQYKHQQKEVQTQALKSNHLDLINIKMLTNWLKQKFNSNQKQQDIFDQKFEQNLSKIINQQSNNHSQDKKDIPSISLQKFKIDQKQKRMPPLICSGYKHNQIIDKPDSQYKLCRLKTRLQEKNKLQSQLKQYIRNSQNGNNLKSLKNCSQRQNQKYNTYYKTKQDFPKIMKHQHHRSQPTSTHQDPFTSPIQNQFINKFIKSQDINLFFDEQTAYLYQCSHAKNYHKVGSAKLNPNQISFLENIYQMLQQLKSYNKIAYQEFISFIRYPYQTVKNNYSGMLIIKNMKLQNFLGFMQKIMHLHRKCPIDQSSNNNFCVHFNLFLNKIKTTLNQSIKLWATNSLQKEIEKENLFQIEKQENDEIFKNTMKEKKLQTKLGQKLFRQLNQIKSSNISRVKRFQTQKKQKKLKS